MWQKGFISELEKLAKPLIAVDFDQTIVESDPKHNYKILGVQKGAVKNLAKLQKKYEIGIFSARSNPRFTDKKAKDMKKYLDENNIPYDTILKGKPFYQYIIDDRARQFRKNWDQLGKL